MSLQTNLEARRVLSQEKEFSRANQTSIKTVSTKAKLLENFPNTYRTNPQWLDLVAAKDPQVTWINKTPMVGSTNYLILAVVAALKDQIMGMDNISLKSMGRELEQIPIHTKWTTKITHKAHRAQLVRVVLATNRVQIVETVSSYPLFQINKLLALWCREERAHPAAKVEAMSIKDLRVAPEVKLELDASTLELVSLYKDSQVSPEQGMEARHISAQVLILAALVGEEVVLD